MSALYLFHGRYCDDPNSLVGLLLFGIRGSPPYARALEIAGEIIRWHDCFIIEPISGERHGVILSEAEMQARAQFAAKQRKSFRNYHYAKLNERHRLIQEKKQP